MTKILLYLAPADPTELQDKLHQIMHDDGHTVLPGGTTDGRIIANIACDVFVITDTAASLTQHETLWRQVVATNTPIIVLKTTAQPTPALLRVYNSVDFTGDQDTASQQLIEQLQWLTDPVLDSFYQTIQQSVQSSLPYAEIFVTSANGTGERPNVETNTPRTDTSAPRRQRFHRLARAAAAVMLLTFIGFLLTEVINTEDPDDSVIALTQQPTRTATPSSTAAPTSAPQDTSTPTGEGCCTPTPRANLPPVTSESTDIPVTASSTITDTPAGQPTDAPLSPTRTPTRTQQPTVFILPTNTPTQMPVFTPTLTLTPTTTLTPTITPTPTRPTPLGAPELDSDRDGIIDSEEINTFNTQVNNPDSDADGIADGVEVYVYYTNPLAADSDGDGVSDADEIRVYQTDPNDPNDP